MIHRISHGIQTPLNHVESFYYRNICVVGLSNGRSLIAFTNYILLINNIKDTRYPIPDTQPNLHVLLSRLSWLALSFIGTYIIRFSSEFPLFIISPVHLTHQYGY